ncbi:MAG: oligosaccharide repeat unit polymerase, partial [Salinivirgaceae bacterium]|nr:oligosaccharide repeat unit polymerase [Salinivirgaceae bacterium]
MLTVNRFISRIYLSNILLSIFLFLLSFIFYILAPDYYSNIYCILLLLIYIIASVKLIKTTTINKNYFTFHLLFVISFFFVNFVYPIFIYPISPTHYSVFHYKFNHDIITKATALALIGFNAYLVGVSFGINNTVYPEIKNKINLRTIEIFLNVILFFIFIWVLFIVGLPFLKGTYGATYKISSGLQILFQVLISISIVFAFYTKSYSGNIVNFIKKFSKSVLLCLLLFLLIFIFSGDRGPAIQVMLLSLVGFSLFVKPMKMRSFIILALIGMLTLTFISYARTQTKDDKSVSLSKGFKYIKLDSFFDIGMDLIVNNRNLYVGYEYANKNGFSYGKSMSYNIFAPFPMVPSLYTKLFFNSTPEELATATIITKESKMTYGVGTNVIVDLYMNFGVFGVVIFMYILGFIVSWLQFKAVYTNSLNYIIAYVIFVSLAIYIPRSTIFDPLRPVIWALGIIYLLKIVRITLLQLSLRR